MGGYTDIVIMLLERNVDINIYDWVSAAGPRLLRGLCQRWERHQAPDGAPQSSCLKSSSEFTS